MFDKVGVSRLAVVTQAAAALYATGRTTGVVMGSGAGLNFVTPVYDGKADLDSSWTNRLAGNALTNFTDQLLRKQDHFLERKVVQEIK
jgi:actin-related protein